MGTRTAIIATTLLLATDRACKIIALKGFIARWSFFDFYPRLHFHQNYGLALDIPAPPAAILTVSAIILGALVAALVHARHHGSRAFAPLLFIITGAASNFFDRLRFGYVIDMFELFPASIWNIADIMILVGLLLLVFRKKSYV